MDAKQLINQLKRETKAHPAKALLLAVMCGVLAYICMPLVTSKSKDKHKTAATETSEKKLAPHIVLGNGASSNDAPYNDARNASTQEELTWQDIAEAIEADPRTKSATEISTDRDPFAPPPEPKVAKLTKPADKQPELAPPKIHVTPDEMGLVLGSTLLGTKSRVAMINGKPYHVYNPKLTDNRRSVVSFPHEQRGDENAAHSTVTRENSYFVLVDVEPRSIVLWRLGRRYELKLPGIALVDRSLSGTRASQHNPVIPESALSPQ